MVGLINDRLFSPAPVKGGGEEEKTLKTVENRWIRGKRSKEQVVRGKTVLYYLNLLFMTTCIATDFLRYIQQSNKFVGLDGLIYFKSFKSMHSRH